jgi:AraC family transcriptional regulator of adaptative response / DNA-3-methyladenine glycosylase II
VEDPRFGAIAGRDARHDGRLYYAVVTTGVYCRPSCPSRTPRPENVRYFAAPAAAEAAGYRACRRCRPTSADRPAARLAEVAAARIADGAVDEIGVAGLARELAVSERHLHRTVLGEFGATPSALAASRRAQTARTLLMGTADPITDIAYAAGFGSLRQFNDVVRAEFGVTPSQLRSGGGESGSPVRLLLRLRRTEPYDAAALLAWERSRAIPGLVVVGEGWLERTLPTASGPAWVRITDAQDHWSVRIGLPGSEALPGVMGTLRRWLDTEADVAQIAGVLRGDPGMRPLLRRHPGLRLPLFADRWEGLVRTVLGQQVSLAAAATLAGRLVAQFGEVVPGAGLRTFPSPEALAEVLVAGMPESRALTVQRLASFVASHGTDGDEVAEGLGALAGIGPWTRDYWSLRVVGDPDAWPGTDLVLRRAAAGRDPERWRPWRAYAAQHLWTAAAEEAV